MKVSYRSQPVMKMLESGTLDLLTVSQTEKQHLSENPDYLSDIWTEYHEKFRKNIMIITEPFRNAAETAKDKIDNIETLTQIGVSYGTIFMGPLVSCFYFNTNKDKYIKIDFSRSKLISYSIPSPINKGRSLKFISEFLQKEAIFLKHKSAVAYFNAALRYHLLIIAFIKFAEVETKLLKPKERAKVINCKYANDTGTDIKIMDSKWFTTLIKSDEFKVRGHFRLQPYKGGKKLIWISDFMKTGYTSKAQKLNPKDKS